ncbi:hypothetical protein M3Y99_01162700 [Aphelenchoides fujianensis]|nr:hypothetical protein M3Y99_01162700 [Aphelenchoides fujianensis]
MAPISFQVNPEFAQITELTPGLFICGVSALTAANMKAFKISLIVNATKEVPNLKSLGEIQRMKLWIDDVPEEDLFPSFDVVADNAHAVVQDGGNVLIHCVAGVSRSATFCLAYLLKYQLRSLRAAYHFMSFKRPMVRPNIGFWRQLIHFEQLCKGNAGSVRLIRDEEQPERLLPDVYLKNAVPEREGERTPSPDPKEAVFTEENRERNNSSGRLKFKFCPKLEPLREMNETAAITA